jgi:hypothetical protein
MKKSSIFLSAIPATLFLTTMFVSSTFAWFSDFAINEGNRVQSGNLAVEFTAATALVSGDLSGDLVNLKTATDPLFNLPNPAQPGDYETFFLRVKSTGNIDINYQIDFVVVDTSALAEVIMFDTARVIPTPTSDVDTTPGTEIEDKDLTNASILSLNQFEIWEVTMRYDTDAGNEYNDNTLDFEVDITLNAWQASNNAPQPVNVRSISDLQLAIANEAPVIRLLNDITASDLDITIDYLVSLSLEGFTLTLYSLTIDTDSYGSFELGQGTLQVVDFVIDTPNAYYNDPNLTLIVTSTAINTLD